MRRNAVSTAMKGIYCQRNVVDENGHFIVYVTIYLLIITRTYTIIVYDVLDTFISTNFVLSLISMQSRCIYFCFACILLSFHISFSQHFITIGNRDCKQRGSVRQPCRIDSRKIDYHYYLQSSRSSSIHPTATIPPVCRRRRRNRTTNCCLMMGGRQSRTCFHWGARKCCTRCMFPDRCTDNPDRRIWKCRCCRISPIHHSSF